MRMLRALLCLLLCPAAALAQVVPVRSGDHQTFTRLVFQLPARIDWTLENTFDAEDTGTAKLTFDRAGLQFDLSTVFERIKRDRLSNIQINASDNSVSLALDCACEAEAFWFQNAMLVVDIVARPEDRKTMVQAAADPPPATQSQPMTTPVPLPQRTGSLASTLVQDSLAQSILQTGVPTPGGSGSMPKAAQPDLAETRDELVRQLGRAASQGLLSPRSAIPAPTVAETGPVTAPVAPDPAPQASEKPQNQQHINVHTSIDRDYMEQMLRRNLGMTDGCLDPSDVDVASWGTSDPFWQQVGPLRTSMTGEFDRLNPKTVRDLAQKYVFFSFGLEAILVADQLALDQSVEVLRALATVMEDGSAPGSILNAQLECPEPASLWAALSYPSLPPDARLDADAIIRAFLRLPDHLRAHLGPGLSTRFLEAGLTDESTLVLRILDRKKETQSVASDMAAAELHLAEGDTKAADNRLSDVVDSNNALSPEALIKKIDNQLARGEGMSVDLVQLASAYAFEHAGTELGARLSRAHILALGASASFDQAFLELDRVEQNSLHELPSVRAELTGQLTNYADKVSFLKYVLSGRIGDISLLSQETALALSKRLLDTGFHGQAQGILARGFNGPLAQDARILRARLALAQSRPRQAEVELLGLDGKEINILRARARSMAGEHSAAHDLFLSAGMQDEANREAWLAKDWAGKNDPVPERPEDAASAPIETASIGSGMLAKNRALLEDVSMTRDSLQELLSQAPNPVLEN